MANILPTHKAVVMPGPRQPLAVLDVPTVPPSADEVLVRVDWVGSTPLDLHQADGGLGTVPNQIPGDTVAGTVVQVGSAVARLSVGDRVISFAHEEPHHKAQQEYVTLPTYRVSKLPDNISLQEGATVSSSLVTVFHSITHSLGLPLPWPVPDGWTPKFADSPILIWGAASSVGIFAVQVLKHWGYKRILAVASSKHHAWLRELGATATFDYRASDVVERILATEEKKPTGPRIPFIYDCIGSLWNSIEPIRQVAEVGTRVAILLPVIVRDASETDAPIYELDVSVCHPDKWAGGNGVSLHGVRTHFYAQNEFFKEHLQPEIVPALLEQGIVRPLKQRVVHGDTLLERAQTALDLLRKREPSGERLVWRVSDGSNV
ncbi:hypothetical protein jhhlp_007441 [Lomentospora prolificans]|uniref:Enoyl reductase (ER) domain-containing protein n=1 Tax=Lomentospora prolificans TaxID=41688 RepID=A0A2N3N118_9PEZI|nr:hypothetical protein jhhlp_007441 [Lomentospora prolificans]